MLDNKYLVINWEWLEDTLSDAELEQFYGYLEKASFDKDEEKYYVINTKEPYAEEVLKVIKSRGYKKPVKITREELLSRLEELSKLEDGEIAHIEAVEALLDYINDDKISDVYTDVPLYFER